MLGVLGLEELEERAYRHLVGVPSESVDGLAQRLQLGPAVAAATLGALEEKGLVARSVAEPDRYVASPPGVALGSLVVQRQEDIRQAQVEVAALVESYRGGASERTLTDVIDVVRGPQAVAQRFAQLQRGARREVLALIRSSVALVSAEDNVDEDVDSGPTCLDAFHSMLRVLADRSDRFTVSTFPGTVSLAAQKYAAPLSLEVGLDLRVAA